MRRWVDEVGWGDEVVEVFLKTKKNAVSKKGHQPWRLFKFGLREPLESTVVVWGSPRPYGDSIR